MSEQNALRLAEIIGGDCAAELRRLHEANQELMHWLKYIQVQTHIGHIHDTASVAIAKAKGESK